MNILPKNVLTLAEAAKKYRFRPVSLRAYVKRKRLEAVKRGNTWYTTDEAVKKYIHSRNVEKIPRSYRRRIRKRHWMYSGKAIQ